jgi:hypothetical protein
MSRQSSGAKDQETAATLRALRRAARRARELGARTKTPVYVIKDQRIVNLTKQRISKRKPMTGRRAS